ncbi:MAG: 16S rRNA (uracil(1498)-N(3))-methyltransferase [Planctomycetaceae bacterium]|nr:16S rRNA (uracil(1498)-N(3))-methyltransferase [Planctomycetaceae bacterium]
MRQTFTFVDASKRELAGDNVCHGSVSRAEAVAFLTSHGSQSRGTPGRTSHPSRAASSASLLALIAMSRRVFSAEPIATDSVVTIADAEAHHLLHVLRVAAGDELTLFDGQGGEFAGAVAGKSRSTVDVQVGQRLPVDRELPFALTLATPLPKGDRTRWLVEKAVEMGVKRLVPLRTQRTEPSANKGSDKLQRYVIEASKQCGRNRLMEIAAPLMWPEWLETAAAERRWIAHPGGQSLAEMDLQRATSTALALGPEGGFTDAEVAEAATAGWTVVGLGARILRIETAAIALCAAATWR